MFADDLFLFGDMNNSNLDCLQAILQTYSKWSGQQVNFSKSAIMFSKSVSESVGYEVGSRLGVNKMGVEVKYMGIQILKLAHRCDTYDFLIEKFENKLAGWKRHILSHAGRT